MSSPEKSIQSNPNHRRSYVRIDTELIGKLTPIQIICYAQILLHANSDYQPLSAMAIETSISVTSLKRAIKVLMAKNIICKKKRIGTADVYSPTQPQEWRL
jgi:predicted transcriptional regulator